MWSLTLPLLFSTLCTVKAINITRACASIQREVSHQTIVSLPGPELYIKDNFHWLSSSDEVSTCSVEPGTADDLSKVLVILGSTRTPFNVKGAGHGSNPGEASTTGVQIAMYQFSKVTYHSSNHTVDIGTGLTWDMVYSELAKFNQTVDGGRLPTVGVPGFILGGGGYSWLSNQRGLTIDTVVSFDVVLANGTLAHASPFSHPDLFFALKGGFNNFGIVYRITLNTFPQGLVWGGLLTFAEEQIPAFTKAFSKFALDNTDPKAQALGIYTWAPQTGLGILLGVFYDAPNPPPGAYDDILAIPVAMSDVANATTFYNFVQSLAPNITDFNAVEPRGLWQGVSVLEWTPSILEQAANQTKFYSQIAVKHGITSLQWSVEPFLSSYFDFSQGGAYPHSSSLPLFPMAIMWNYNSSTEDSFVHDSIIASADLIVKQAVSEGQHVGGSNQIIYPNYAIYDAPLSALYGTNVGRLKSIKAAYDPQDIMGLAGGVKIPL